MISFDVGVIGAHENGAEIFESNIYSVTFYLYIRPIPRCPL